MGLFLLLPAFGVKPFFSRISGGQRGFKTPTFFTVHHSIEPLGIQWKAGRRIGGRKIKNRKVEDRKIVMVCGQVGSWQRTERQNGKIIEGKIIRRTPLLGGPLEERAEL